MLQEICEGQSFAGFGSYFYDFSVETDLTISTFCEFIFSFFLLVQVQINTLTLKQSITQFNSQLTVLWSFFLQKDWHFFHTFFFSIDWICILILYFISL